MWGEQGKLGLPWAQVRLGEEQAVLELQKKVALLEEWLLADCNSKMPSYKGHKVLVNKNCSHESQSSLTQRQCGNNLWSLSSAAFLISVLFHKLPIFPTEAIWFLCILPILETFPWFFLWNINLTQDFKKKKMKQMLKQRLRVKLVSDTWWS